MSINDNVERAFPVEYDHGQGGTAVQFGMSLRDYFAAKSLPIAWDAFTNGIITSEDGEIGTNQAVAQCAYRFADAMLAESVK